jgi:hypothetical protein
LLFSFCISANEDSTEHESSLEALEKRWQELHNQILDCEKDIQQLIFDNEMQALVNTRNEYQTWLDLTPSSDSNTELQV